MSCCRPGPHRARANRPGRRLRLRAARGLCSTTRRHSLHRRRTCARRGRRPLPARFAIPRPHARRAGRRGRRRPVEFCPSPRTVPHPRRRARPGCRKPICCSSPAASPPANSTWSSRRWPAPARASISPASASSRASRSCSANSPSRMSRVQNQIRAKCCFGLPGNPVSSAVTFLLFAAPMLAALAGRREVGPRFALAGLPADVKAKPGLTRFLPAQCTFAPPAIAPRVASVPWQGSGDLAAMARSNCFLVVPEDAGQTQGRRYRPHSASVRRSHAQTLHSSPISTNPARRHGRRRRQAAHPPHRHRFGVRRAVRGRARRPAREPQGQSAGGGALRRHPGRQAHRRADPHVPSAAAHPRRCRGADRQPAACAYAPPPPPSAPPASRWKRSPPPPSPRSPFTT